MLMIINLISLAKSKKWIYIISYHTSIFSVNPSPIQTQITLKNPLIFQAKMMRNLLKVRMFLKKEVESHIRILKTKIRNKLKFNSHKRKNKDADQ